MKKLMMATGAALAAGWVCAQGVSAVVPAEASAPVAATTAVASAAQSLTKDETVQLTAAEQIGQQFNEFAQKRGVGYGEVQKDGSCYYKAFAVVALAPQKPEFIKSRSLAFARAYNDALAQHVKYRTGAMASESVSRLFQDESNDVMEPPKSLEACEKGLQKKLAVLAEAKVDKALAELGVDAAKYTAKPIEQRRQTLLDSILKKSMVQALGSAAGLATVKTLEARTADGVYAIGVILKYDPTYEAIAGCIAAKQRPMVAPKQGVALAELLGTGDERMLQNLGMRLYYDENGVPALLSFGQWSTQYTGTDSRKLERARKNALEQAESLANIQLSEFICGSVEFRQEQQMSEAIDEANVFDGNGSMREDSAVKLTDVLQRKISVAARDTLRGRQVVYSGLLKHPAGHTVAIVVVRWSFDQLDAVNSQLAPRRPQQAVESKDSGVGVRVGDEYDF